MDGNKRKAALALCKEIWGDDVHIQAGFMVGLPYESEESIIETAAYLRDPSCPINEAWMFPVNMFNGEHPDSLGRNNWIYKSDFDNNYSKYGYYFDPPIIPLDTRWKKQEDGSGIVNSEQAAQIAGKWDKTIPKRIYTGDFYKSSLDHPVLSNREFTKKMTQDEYEKFISSLDLEDVFYKTVMSQYFQPLIQKLQSK
jgi:hypothetical protein